MNETATYFDLDIYRKVLLGHLEGHGGWYNIPAGKINHTRPECVEAVAEQVYQSLVLAGEELATKSEALFMTKDAFAGLSLDGYVWIDIEGYVRNTPDVNYLPGCHKLHSYIQEKNQTEVVAIRDMADSVFEKHIHFRHPLGLRSRVIHNREHELYPWQLGHIHKAEE